MKVCDCNDYNSEYPEYYPWGGIDSPKLSSLASILTARIRHSFAVDPNRTEIPGLRAALNEISKLADI